MSEDVGVGGRSPRCASRWASPVEELAERSGCDAALIRRIEAGELAPSLAPLIKIARALGVRLGTLLDDATGLGPVVSRRDKDGRGRHAARSLETGAGAGTLDFFSLAAGQGGAPHGAVPHRHPPRLRAGGAPVHARGGGVHLRARRARSRSTYGKDMYALEAGRQHLLRPHRPPPRAARPASADARVLAVVYAPIEHGADVRAHHATDPRCSAGAAGGGRARTGTSSSTRTATCA